LLGKARLPLGLLNNIDLPMLFDEHPQEHTILVQSQLYSSRAEKVSASYMPGLLQRYHCFLALSNTFHLLFVAFGCFGQI
jgi:hypothetical protein